MIRSTHNHKGHGIRNLQTRCGLGRRYRALRRSNQLLLGSYQYFLAALSHSALGLSQMRPNFASLPLTKIPIILQFFRQLYSCI